MEGGFFCGGVYDCGSKSGKSGDTAPSKLID